MLFKLSFENMKKSFKDYAIYFLTLVLGVAIFYMFNSLDSQEAMLNVSQSSKEIIKLMISMLGMVSVFVAVILGLLIVYANNFLINRRKKEFGIYMTLGMGKTQISKIILMETILIGIISLGIGIVIGVFATQLMSVLVSKLFEANMSEFTFVFSRKCVCFAIMYIAVAIFNTITISRYKLIHLLTALKKNEKVKIKNPFLCVIIFILASSILGYAYWKVTGGIQTLNTADKILPVMIMGIVSTILIFWSLSGFVLNLIKSMKKVYLKDSNMFVLRQINNKINTMVVSMSVICLMLFMTISILSSSLSLRNTMQKDLKEMTPVDINLYKTANLPEKSVNHYGKENIYTKEAREDSKITIQESLKNSGMGTDELKDVVEIPIYTIKDLTMGTFFGESLEQVKAQFPMLGYNTPEEIVKISDYNKIAKLYGIKQYELKEDAYMVLCDFDNMAKIRNQALEKKNTLTIGGKQYKAKYQACQEGFIIMSTSHINTGIILVPDDCPLTEENKEMTFLAANYKATTNEEKEKIEEMFTNRNASSYVQKLYDQGITIDGTSKISIMESSVGLATIITFISIYLGVIFLIASSAILALKQLTESSDHRQRYIILRKIGCDENMINRALFRQIGIFFAMPLILAIVHSVFGIQFVLSMMAGLASTEDLLPSVVVTVVVIGAIYAAYFLATYLGSKNIIKDVQ